MKRIFLGISVLFSLIMNIAMLITYGVLEYFSARIEKFNQDKVLALWALIIVSILSIILIILFIRECKRKKTKITLRGLFKDLSNEINGITTAYSVYIEEEKHDD